MKGNRPSYINGMKNEIYKILQHFQVIEIVPLSYPFQSTSKCINIKGLMFSPSPPSLMDGPLLYRGLVDRIG